MTYELQQDWINQVKEYEWHCIHMYNRVVPVFRAMLQPWKMFGTVVLNVVVWLIQSKYFEANGHKHLSNDGESSYYA